MLGHECVCAEIVGWHRVSMEVHVHIQGQNLLFSTQQLSEHSSLILSNQFPLGE